MVGVAGGVQLGGGGGGGGVGILKDNTFIYSHLDCICDQNKYLKSLEGNTARA